MRTRNGFLAMAASGLLLSVVQPARAAQVWHGPTRIKAIYPYQDASFVLVFTTESPSCTNALTPKYYYVEVGANGVNATLAKNILAVAMLGLAQDKPVSVMFDNSTSSCYVGALYLSGE
jgi:hypothetical protein